MKAPLKLTIRETPDDRFVVTAVKEGHFKVFRAFVTQAELLRWLAGEIGHDGLLFEAMEQSLQPASIDQAMENAAAARFAERMAAAKAAEESSAVEIEIYDSRKEAPEPNSEPALPQRRARRPIRTRAEKIAALVSFVAAAGGDKRFVRVTISQFGKALDMTDSGVCDTIKWAVEAKKVIKESRSQDGRPQSWFRLLSDSTAKLAAVNAPALAVASAPDETAVRQEANGDVTGRMVQPAGKPLVPAGAPDAAMEAVLRALREVSAKIQRSSFDLHLKNLAEKSRVDFREIKAVVIALSRRGDIVVKEPIEAGWGHRFTLREGA